MASNQIVRATDHSGLQSESAVRAAFSSACLDLWNNEVRPDLIYDRGLLFCKGCLGFFSAEDKNSTHPKDQTFQLAQLCTQHHVSTPETFMAALWHEAVELQAAFGKIVMPRSSPLHLE